MQITNIQDLMMQSSEALSENAARSFQENSVMFSEMILALEMLNHWEMNLINLEQNVSVKCPYLFIDSISLFIMIIEFRLQDDTEKSIISDFA